MYQSPGPTPSGSRSSTPAARTAPAVVTRSTPSAPSPRRRSHKAATAAGVSGSSACMSGNSTKSFCVPWPLAKFTSPGYVPPGPYRVVDGAGGRVEPVDAVVPAKPRALPSHIAAGGNKRGLPGGVAGAARVEVGDHLGVAQRPGGGHAVAQPAAQQPDDLVDQAGREHRVGAPGQPLIEKLCVAI